MKQIKSIEIKGSSFFQDNFKLNFSEKLNCIMGGRGTGKSTILFMIQSSLEKEAEYDKDIYSILQNNLGEGIITLNIEDKYGKSYKIVKTFNEEPQPYLMPKENHVSIDYITTDVECDIYRATAIEEIGRDSKSRLALIDKMLSEEIKNLYDKITEKQTALNENTYSIRMANVKVKQLEDKLKDYENAVQDLENHKKQQPEDIIKEEKEQFEGADRNEKVRLAEKRFSEKVINIIRMIQSDSFEKVVLLEKFLSEELGIEEFVNKDLLINLVTEVKDSFNRVLNSYKSNSGFLKVSLFKADKVISELVDRHQIQQSEFVKLKQKFDKHKLYYTKYNQLSKRIDEKQTLLKESQELKINRDKWKEARKSLVSELNTVKKEIFNKRYEKVQQLNLEFNGSIKIILTFSGITGEYEEALRNTFKGSGMRYNTIIPNIVRNFTPDRFAELVHNKDSNSLKNIAGIDEERSNDIFNLLYESEAIYKIEGIYCPDLPDFLLKIDSRDILENKNQENYKKTDELSTGQRCTTVLPIIFAVSDNPLLIDQPEDNLDNKYISDTIHKIIKEEKTRRQLIFITHNPNIPVLSDAENNVFLSYKEKKSSIEKQGDIDFVKGNILNLLEGGKEAFEKRYQLYGR